jgi:ribulose-phosphate 3-epimerase
MTGLWNSADMIDEKGYKVYIQVDGGVDSQNAPRLIAAGVNVLVAGTAVFASDDPVAAIAQLKSL